MSAEAEADRIVKCTFCGADVPESWTRLVPAVTYGDIDAPGRQVQRLCGFCDRSQVVAHWLTGRNLGDTRWIVHDLMAGLNLLRSGSGEAEAVTEPQGQ